MSDILIKGMEMPKKHPVTVTIFPDGISVVKTISGRRFTATAVPVPPHGDLIDRDACVNYARDNDSHAWESLAYAPTIIPADKEDGV